MRNRIRNVGSWLGLLTAEAAAQMRQWDHGGGPSTNSGQASPCTPGSASRPAPIGRDSKAKGVVLSGAPRIATAARSVAEDGCARSEYSPSPSSHWPTAPAQPPCASPLQRRFLTPPQAALPLRPPLPLTLPAPEPYFPTSPTAGLPAMNVDLPSIHLNGRVSECPELTFSQRQYESERRGQTIGGESEKTTFHR